MAVIAAIRLSVIKPKRPKIILLSYSAMRSQPWVMTSQLGRQLNCHGGTGHGRVCAGNFRQEEPAGGKRLAALEHHVALFDCHCRPHLNPSSSPAVEGRGFRTSDHPDRSSLDGRAASSEYESTLDIAREIRSRGERRCAIASRMLRALARELLPIARSRLSNLGRTGRPAKTDRRRVASCEPQDSFSPAGAP